jgi:DNA invertase Pin-like site-specific DNA recombinase
MAAREPDLKRWAAVHGDDVTWYRDKFTGKSMDRSGWTTLANAISSGKIARIVVWRLDRLDRLARRPCSKRSRRRR